MDIGDVEPQCKGAGMQIRRSGAPPKIARNTQFSVPDAEGEVLFRAFLKFHLACHQCSRGENRHLTHELNKGPLTYFARPQGSSRLTAYWVSGTRYGE